MGEPTVLETAGCPPGVLPWWQMPLLGFDLETTGVDVETARIVTANLTWHHPDTGVWVHDVLVDPGVEIPAEAAAVHGVSTEFARVHGQRPQDAIPVLLDLLRRATAAGVPLVGYNVVYDVSVLDREARRYGLDPFTPVHVIDPLVLDKELDTYRRGSRKLTDVCALHHVVLENAHAADADALAAVLLARAMGQTGRLPGDVAALHGAQVGWYRAQAASFEEYCVRKGRVLDGPVNRSWPLIPVSAAVAA